MADILNAIPNEFEAAKAEYARLMAVTRAASAMLQTFAKGPS